MAIDPVEARRRGGYYVGSSYRRAAGSQLASVARRNAAAERGGVGVQAKITGLPELRAALAGIVPKLRVRALRNALKAGARVVQKTARAATPVINPSSVPVRKGYRAPGTVRKAISVRTSKLATRAGNVGVFVNVRPAKKGARGAKNPRDPFYWRFIEFGTVNGTRAWQFLQAGAKKLPEALAVFTAKIGPQIQKMNKPKAPAP